MSRTPESDVKLAEDVSPSGVPFLLRLHSELQEVTGLSGRSASQAEDWHHHGQHTPSPELQRTGR